MNFNEYLQQRQLSPKSINTYKRYINIFFNWLKETDSQAQELAYTDLLEYVKFCGKRGLKQDYINKIMGAVRHYYNYLKYIGLIKNNPANGLYIRGRRRTMPHDLLTLEQLDEIYNNFNQRGPSGKRNKIMLGLMIYQGLNTNELEQLESCNLKLREGKIEIPGTRRSNRRILKLEAHQMLDLQEYLSKTRALILELSEKETGKLLISIGISDTLRGSLDKLIQNLKKQYNYFVNAQQIRQSRISLWIKQYDIRQVQYMAGHKYVSSTERYQSTNLDELKKELEKHHPSME